MGNGERTAEQIVWSKGVGGKDKKGKGGGGRRSKRWNSGAKKKQPTIRPHRQSKHNPAHFIKNRTGGVGQNASALGWKRGHTAGRCGGGVQRIQEVRSVHPKSGDSRDKDGRGKKSWERRCVAGCRIQTQEGTAARRQERQLKKGKRKLKEEQTYGGKVRKI